MNIISSRNILHLGESDTPDFEGAHITVANVLKRLPEANVLHLACYGDQDINNPLQSGFILANGE